MLKLSRVALWLRFFCAALMMAYGAAELTTPLQAQERSGLRSNPAVATDGATLIHGNYCGAGNRPGKPPIDALDLACMNHDACSPTGGVPTCECNARLRDEAAAVSRDPRQAPELRSLASLTAAAATMMICNPTITDAEVTPPAIVTPVPAPPAAASAVAPPAAGPTATITTAPIAGVPAAAAPVADAASPAPPMSIVPAGAAPVADAPGAPAESSPAAVEPRARSLP